MLCALQVEYSQGIARQLSARLRQLGPAKALKVAQLLNGMADQPTCVCHRVAKVKPG